MTDWQHCTLRQSCAGFVCQPITGSNRLVTECTITVELTGQLQHHLQHEQLTLDCSQTPTLAGVLGALAIAAPASIGILGEAITAPQELTALPPGLLIMRQQAMLPRDPQTAVSDGDRLTLIPMISGG